MGIVFLIGGTGVGKTTMGQHISEERAEERAVPLLIDDPEGVLHHKGATEIREQTPSESLVKAVWERGEDVVYTPRGEDVDPKDEDTKKLFRMAIRGGNIVLMVDECAHYAAANAPAISTSLHLCRVHRLMGVDLVFTTQAPKDIHPRIWNLRHEVYIFNLEDEGSIDYVQAQLRLPDRWRKRISSLPRFRFIKWEKRTNVCVEGEEEA